MDLARAAEMPLFSFFASGMSVFEVMYLYVMTHWGEQVAKCILNFTINGLGGNFFHLSC